MTKDSFDNLTPQEQEEWNTAQMPNTPENDRERFRITLEQRFKEAFNNKKNRNLLKQLNYVELPQMLKQMHTEEIPAGAKDQGYDPNDPNSIQFAVIGEKEDLEEAIQILQLPSYSQVHIKNGQTRDPKNIWDSHVDVYGVYAEALKTVTEEKNLYQDGAEYMRKFRSKK